MQGCSPPEHGAGSYVRHNSQGHQRKDSYDSSDAAKSPTSGNWLLNQANASKSKGQESSSPYATPRQTKGTVLQPAGQSNGPGTKAPAAAWAVSPYLQPPPRSSHQHTVRAGHTISENASQPEINVSPRKASPTQQQQQHMSVTRQGRMGQLMHAYGIMNNNSSNSHNSRGSTPNTYDTHGFAKRERKGGWSTPPMTPQYGTKPSGLRGIHHTSSLGRQADVRHQHISYSIAARQHNDPTSSPWGQDGQQQAGWFADHDGPGSHSDGSAARGIATTSDSDNSDESEPCTTGCSPAPIPIIVTEGDTVVGTHTLSGGNFDGNHTRPSGGMSNKSWSRPASHTRSNATAAQQQTFVSVPWTHHIPAQVPDLGASFSYDDIPNADAEEVEDDNEGNHNTIPEEEGMYGGVTLDQFMAHYQTTPASQAATSGLGQPEQVAEVCCSGQDTCCSGEEDQYAGHSKSSWDSSVQSAVPWPHQTGSTSTTSAASDNTVTRIRPHSGIRLRALDAPGYVKKLGSSILNSAFSHSVGSGHLDLRPATAATPTMTSPEMELAGLQSSCVLAGSSQQESVAPVRQVDLASLPQSLFTPTASRGSSTTQHSLNGGHDLGRRPVVEYGMTPATTQAWSAQLTPPVGLQSVRATGSAQQPTAAKSAVPSASTPSQEPNRYCKHPHNQASSRHAACEGLQEADAQSVQAAAAAALVRPSGPSPGNTRQVQSARPGTRDDTPIDPTVWRDYIQAQLERPPSRQKPPSASLHLWQPVGYKAGGQAPQAQAHGLIGAGKLNTRPVSAMPITTTTSMQPGNANGYTEPVEQSCVDQHSNMCFRPSGPPARGPSIHNPNARTAW